MPDTLRCPILSLPRPLQVPDTSIPNPAAVAMSGLPFLAFLTWHIARRRGNERKSTALLTQAIESGLNEPASLHPVIDPNRCLSSMACVAACPEQAICVIAGQEPRAK